jgi:hypothetical protein
VTRRWRELDSNFRFREIGVGLKEDGYEFSGSCPQTVYSGLRGQLVNRQQTETPRNSILITDKARKIAAWMGSQSARSRPRLKGKFTSCSAS